MKLIKYLPISVTSITLGWNCITLLAEKYMTVNQCAIIWLFNAGCLCMTLERIDSEIKRKACRITLHALIGIGQMVAGYIYPNQSEEINKVVEEFEKK